MVFIKAFFLWIVLCDFGNNTNLRGHNYVITIFPGFRCLCRLCPRRRLCHDAAKPTKKMVQKNGVKKNGVRSFLATFIPPYFLNECVMERSDPNFLVFLTSPDTVKAFKNNYLNDSVFVKDC